MWGSVSLIAQQEKSLQEGAYMWILDLLKLMEKSQLSQDDKTM